MSTSPDVSSLTRGLLDDELIDLEPSLELEVAGFGQRAAAGSASGWSREPWAACRARSTRCAAAGWARPPCFSRPSSRCLFVWSLFDNQTDHWLVSLMMFLQVRHRGGLRGHHHQPRQA